MSMWTHGYLSYSSRFNLVRSYFCCCPDRSRAGRWELLPWAPCPFDQCGLLFCFFLSVSGFLLSVVMRCPRLILHIFYPSPWISYCSKDAWPFKIYFFFFLENVWFLFSTLAVLRLSSLTSLCVSPEVQVLEESFQVPLQNKECRNGLAIALLRLLCHRCQML